MYSPRTATEAQILHSARKAAELRLKREMEYALLYGSGIPEFGVSEKLHIPKLEKKKDMKPLQNLLEDL